MIIADSDLILTGVENLIAATICVDGGSDSTIILFIWTNLFAKQQTAKVAEFLVSNQMVFDDYLMTAISDDHNSVIRSCSIHIQ